MSNGEHDPTDKTPDRQQRQELQRVAVPAIIYDSTHAVAVSRNEKGSLIVRVTTGGIPLFTAAVSTEDDVHVLFPAKRKKAAARPAPSTNTDQQPAAAQKELLPLAIAIEGYPVRSARYDEKTKRFGMTIAHHPDPNDRKNNVVYYDLMAEGDNAAAFYALRLTDTKTPVHVTGIDRSQEVARKGSKTGEKKLIRLIEAESIERIVGRQDNPNMLREKIRLADLL